MYSHLMLILATALGLALIGFGIVAFLTTGAPGLEGYERDSAATGVPDTWTPAALEQVRFDVVLRGYRMDQVDALLDRMAAEIRARDEQLAALTTTPHVPADGG